MNFMNRKLFRGRAARDKLNKMGGIMASSQPLMNTVQNFQVGGNVSPFRMTGNPTLTGGPVVNRGAAISQGLSNIGSSSPVFSNFQSIPRQYGVGPQGQARALMSIPQIMPTQAQNRAAERRIEGGIIDFLGLGKRRVFDREEQAPRTQDQDALKRSLQEQGYDLSGDQQLSPQPSTLGSMEPDVESMTNPLGRPRTPVEAESDALAESLMPSDMVAPGTREAEEEGMGEGVLSGFTMITGEERPTTKSGAEKPAPATVSSSPTTESAIAANRTAADTTRKQLISMFENPSISEKEKNDAMLEQFGYKSPEEDIKGLKKRAELNAEMYRDFAGVDPEEDKKIDGYNLAMMGFMIAAGDSPDALQNIAQGMAKGTSMMMDTKKARQERDRQFRMAGLDKAITDDKERKQLAIDAYNKMQDRQFSLLTEELKDYRQKETVLLQLSAREKMLTAELDVKRELAQADNISAEKRAEYTANVSILEKQIALLGSVGALAFSELGVADALEGDNFGKKVDEISNDPTKMAQAERIASMSKTTKTGPQAMTPERFAQELMTDQKWVESTTYAILEDLKAQGIEKPTQSQINTELRNRAGQQASTPITGGAAAPADDRPNTVFDTQPSDAELQQLYQQGVRQITIGNQTYPLQSQ